MVQSIEKRVSKCHYHTEILYCRHMVECQSYFRKQC